MAEYSEIELTGLTGSNPLGAMAACGLLRICTIITEISNPQLFWRMGDDWYAVLRVKNDLSSDDLVLIIETYLEKKKKTFYTIDEIKIEPEVFRSMAVTSIESASSNNRADADYWTAFGSEKATDKSKNLVKPTEFHMTSGKQGFLDKMRKSLNIIKKDNIREALFGPWKYNDTHESAMGWDPTTGRFHAHRNKEPRKDKSPLCESAAEWLGFESLPLFPTAESAGKLLTTGFSRDGFTWPIWEKPIALDTLRTMLASKEIMDNTRNAQKLRIRGISTLYSSTRLEFAKGYAIFRPPKRLWYK